MTRIELVIDTNVVSYQFRGGTPGLRYEELIGGRPSGITLLTLAEIHYGRSMKNWASGRQQRFDEFLSQYSVIPGTRSIAQLCGELRAQRRRIGRPLDVADAWLAATALWYDIPLVTHDRDYEFIAGLQIITLHDTWRVEEPGTEYQFVPGRAEIVLQ